MQGIGGVGPQIQAEPTCTKGVGLLVDPHLVTVALQREGRGETSDSRTDDGDAHNQIITTRAL
jgi:hypothetical protein